MAILLQSVARAVGRFGSKFRTPFMHWRMISDFDASNAWSRSGDHWNGAFVDKRCLKGAISGAVAKVYEIWAMHPYQLQTSVIFGYPSLKS